MRKRKIYPPSSGHFLVRLVTTPNGRRLFSGDEARKHLDSHSHTISLLSGPAGADWAVNQLANLPAKVMAVGAERSGARGCGNA